MKKLRNMFNYKTFDSYNALCNGTSLMGYVDADYKVLKKLFGKPLEGDGYKVDAEWVVVFNNKTVATIILNSLTLVWNAYLNIEKLMK